MCGVFYDAPQGCCAPFSGMAAVKRRGYGVWRDVVCNVSKAKMRRFSVWQSRLPETQKSRLRLLGGL